MSSTRRSQPSRTVIVVIESSIVRKQMYKCTRSPYGEICNIPQLVVAQGEM